MFLCHNDEKKVASQKYLSCHGSLEKKSQYLKILWSSKLQKKKLL